MGQDNGDGRYEEQLRGDRGAYERYLAGMDASMQQKVALTAAHLLCQGRVADMGMGSGTGSFSLAALYPGLTVVGVDVSEEMVEIARDKHDLPNLSFIVGDVAQPVFEPGSLDGILDSSVLHHVTTFTDYDRDAAARALRVQADALRDGGVLVVRDFLAPEVDDEIWLDVHDDDGHDDAKGDPSGCSTAALLHRFSLEFRSLHQSPGFAMTEVPSPTQPELAPGRRRFALRRRHANEFVLRKDYRRDWTTEVMEEYTYLDQGGFERVFAGLGLRTLASTPIRNPWIVANRFEGKFAMWTTAGAPIALPPTNYVIVGERVAAGRGVRWQNAPAKTTGFLKLEHFAHRATGRVLDVVRRPHLTLDAIPWFVHDNDLRVLARMSYPRPLLGLGDGDGLDGSRPPGWVTEPLTVIADDKPWAQTVEDALHDRAAIEPKSILAMHQGATYYPSPGGIQEEVRSVFVQIDPVFARTALPDSSGFSSSGRVAAIEACQLLRAAQVGGLPDARLEMGVYALLRAQNRSPGPWIGAAIAVGDTGGHGSRTEPATLLARAPRRAFGRARDGANFLEVRATTVTECDRQGAPLHARVLEYVVPRPLSSRTVATALLRMVDGVPCIGVDDDDLPAAQCIGGDSSLIVTPAWRLPRAIGQTAAARSWIGQRLRIDYGLRVGHAWDLGGRYHPAPGSTPEVVHPIAWQVIGEAPAPRTLHWVALTDLLAHDALLIDGHLRVVAFRAAHAVGLLG